jgi:hypothetical protein
LTKLLLLALLLLALRSQREFEVGSELLVEILVNLIHYGQRLPLEALLFRLYGPLEPWFDKTWRPGEPELVK